MSIIKRIFGKKKSSVKVYWWQYQPPDKLNFGDELTPYIVQRLFKQDVIHAAPSECELIGIGSILEIAQREEVNPIHVWGSGFIKDGPPNNNTNLTFHSVRGEYTKRRVLTEGQADIPVGDPGLLLPLCAPASKTPNKYKLGIIPHYVDSSSEELDRFRNDPEVYIIDPLWDIDRIVEAITSCRIILSSSLHGLIVSDAYNIPNYWIRLSDKLTGGDYKFKDYYSAFNESPTRLNLGAVQKDNLEELVFNYSNKSRKIAVIQKKLIEAYPFR